MDHHLSIARRKTIYVLVFLITYSYIIFLISIFLNDLKMLWSDNFIVKFLSSITNENIDESDDFKARCSGFLEHCPVFGWKIYENKTSLKFKQYIFNQTNQNFQLSLILATCIQRTQKRCRDWRNSTSFCLPQS